MKKLHLLFALFVFLFISTDILAQGIPETINYQGVLKDAAGIVVPNGDYNITFKIYEVTSGGPILWEETKLINVQGGFVNTQLGSYNPFPPNIFDGPLWLGITVGAGGELTPRIELTSVPFSFYTLNVVDGSITAAKIADAQVVKSLNGLKDNVNLVAGSNVTITPSGNNITISSTGGGSGIGGSGTTNYIPLFTGSTTLSNSVLYQANNNIGLGTSTPDFNLTINSDLTNGLGLKVFKSTTGGLCGLSMVDQTQGINLKGWSFVSFDQKLKINTTADNGYTPLKNLITFDRNGNIGIGTENPEYPLHVATNSINAGYFTTDALWTAHAVHGEYIGTEAYDAIGVYGKSVPADYYGIGGYFFGGYKGAIGIVEPTGSVDYYGVYGLVNGGNGQNYGIYGEAGDGNTNYAIFGYAYGGTTNWAGYFWGDVYVSGTISKGGGSFKIDHPLDPTNKNLYHSFVESPDMMNIYNGNVVTDASGYATVTMPDWFEALNKEFRYQLTVIGDFAQAIISQKIQNNQFIIRTDKSNIEVSWQVTGIRHDKFAEKYRIPVEENKTGKDVGKYLHPDAYGVSETLGVDYENNKTNREKK
jgi:hypothetical protein